jgi:hypothetical protein
MDVDWAGGGASSPVTARNTIVRAPMRGSSVVRVMERSLTCGTEVVHRCLAVHSGPFWTPEVTPNNRGGSLEYRTLHIAVNSIHTNNEDYPRPQPEVLAPTVYCHRLGELGLD